MVWNAITLHVCYVEDAKGKGPVLGIVHISFTLSESTKHTRRLEKPYP